MYMFFLSVNNTFLPEISDFQVKHIFWKLVGAILGRTFFRLMLSEFAVMLLRGRRDNIYWQIFWSRCHLQTNGGNWTFFQAFLLAQLTFFQLFLFGILKVLAGLACAIVSDRSFFSLNNIFYSCIMWVVV